MMIPVQPPALYFTGLDGDPLDAGYVYLGAANQNPESVPVLAYWDQAGTQPAALPLRTLNGYVVRSGSPSAVYVAGDYSITVKDAHGRLVLYAPTSDSLQQSLSDATSGAGIVAFDPDENYVTATLGWAIKQGAINVKWQGAIGNGTANDYTAIQTAVTAVMALSKRPAIYFPSGTYLTNGNIVVPQAAMTGLRILGDGKQRSTLKAGAGCTRVLDFSAAVDPNTRFERTEIVGLDIDGAGIAQYGLYAPFMAHSTYRSCRVTGTTVAGMDIGYGFCSTFDDLEIVNNTGDGLVLTRSGGQGNGTTITNCKLFINNGFGLKVSDSYAVSVDGGTVIESNKKGGIFIGPNAVVMLDTVYFEANGQDGFTFTSPASTPVKADIIVNGAGTETVIAAATPSTVSVVGCYFSASHTTYAVYAPGADGLLFENNALLTGTQTAAIGLYGNNSGSSSTASFGGPKRWKIGYNRGWTQVFDILPLGTGVLDYTGIASLTKLESAENRNLAEPDLNQYANVAAGVATTYQRGTTAHPADAFAPVWEIVTAGSGTSDTYGFTVNAADHLQWNGKYMVFAMWTKHSFAGDGNAVLIVNGVPLSSSFESDTNWKLQCGVMKWPASGSLTFGVRKIGAAGTIAFAGPVLAELGSDIQQLAAAAMKPRRDFMGATPTVGTWKRGDRVWSLTPSAAGSPGVVCTTGGGAGTFVFKAMANLAA